MSSRNRELTYPFVFDDLIYCPRQLRHSKYETEINFLKRIQQNNNFHHLIEITYNKYCQLNEKIISTNHNLMSIKGELERITRNGLRSVEETNQLTMCIIWVNVLRNNRDNWEREAKNKRNLALELTKL